MNTLKSFTNLDNQGEYSKFYVLNVAYLGDIQINKVYSSYEAGEPAKKYLRVLTEAGNLMIIMAENSYLAATVVNPSGRCQYITGTCLQNLLEIADDFPVAETVWDIYKIDPVDGEECLFTVAGQGYYGRKWHLEVAAEYFHLWKRHPYLDVDLSLASRKNSYLKPLPVDHNPYIGNDLYMIVNKRIVVLTFQMEGVLQGHKHWKLYGSHLFINDKLVSDDIGNLLELHDFLHSAKLKPNVILPLFLKKDAVNELAFKYHKAICKTYSDKLENLKAYTSLDTLRGIFGNYADKVICKEYGLEVSKRRPLGRK